MKSSTQDKVEGTYHQVKGKVKEVAGKLSDNPELEAEGAGEKMAGEVRSGQEGLGELISNQEGGSHVVDDCCSTGHFMAVGVGERLYDREFYSYPAGRCHHHCAD